MDNQLNPGKSVDISEIYNHTLGGKVLVVRYGTRNAGHPGFSMTALEGHIAVITLNTRGEVISAFCMWGTYHEMDEIGGYLQHKTWDLVNQRWIPSEALSYL